MTLHELRALERLFVALGDLRDRMDDRFDNQDERLRKVEEFAASQASAEAVRAKHLADLQINRDKRTITKRWIIGVLATFGTIVVGAIGIVVRVVKDSS